MASNLVRRPVRTPKPDATLMFWENLRPSPPLMAVTQLRDLVTSFCLGHSRACRWRLSAVTQALLTIFFLSRPLLIITAGRTPCSIETDAGAASGALLFNPLTALARGLDAVGRFEHVIDHLHSPTTCASICAGAVKSFTPKAMASWASPSLVTKEVRLRLDRSLPTPACAARPRSSGPA